MRESEALKTRVEAMGIEVLRSRLTYDKSMIVLAVSPKTPHIQGEIKRETPLDLSGKTLDSLAEVYFKRTMLFFGREPVSIHEARVWEVLFGKKGVKLCRCVKRPCGK